MWRDYTIKSLLSKIMAVGPLLSAKLRRTATADGDEILHRVADRYPELIFSGMIKLAKVTRIEVVPQAFRTLRLEALGSPMTRKAKSTSTSMANRSS
jgi:hypothetical protein